MKKKGQYISKKKRQHYYKKAPKITKQNTNNNQEQEIEQKINKKTPLIKNSTIIFALFAILLISFFVYIPTFKNEITNWDDNKYITENPLLKEFSGETIINMFASKNAKELFWMGNYHPLTMLSLNINYQMTGEDENENIDPFIYQLTNILLHLINTILLFFIIYLLFKNFPVAISVALLFGVHTIHVESVTWISERKDVLYTAFYLSSLLFYIKYLLQPKNSPKKYSKNLLYIIALIFFIFSLLSKAQAVSLAVTLIAVDYYLNRNLLNIKVILEKLPFLLLGIIFGYIAIRAQDYGEAIQSDEGFGFLRRIIIAGWAFTQYLFQLFAPVKLSASYPYPDILHKTIPSYFALGLIPSAGAVALLLFTHKRSKEIAFGVIFFILNIALLLQLIPVGSAMHADRYAYIPSIGFFIVIAFLIDIGKNKIQQLDFNIGKIRLSLFYVLLLFFVLFLSYTTWNRTQIWKDTLTLWTDVVTKQPKSVVAWNNRGSEYNRVSNNAKDEYDYKTYQEYALKAIADFTKAVERKPDYEHAFYNRGYTKRNLAEYLNDTTLMYDAIKDLTQTIEITLRTNSGFTIAFQVRGGCYDFLGEHQQAIDDYNIALGFDPEDDGLIISKGVAKGKLGRYKEAINDFNLAIQINPENSSAYVNRGLAKSRVKDLKGAIADYNKSIELDPTQFTSFINRSLIKYSLGDIAGAITDLNKAIELKKDLPDIYYTRGLYLIELGKLEEACTDFNTSDNLGYVYAKQLIEKYCN